MISTESSVAKGRMVLSETIPEEASYAQQHPQPTKGMCSTGNSLTGTGGRRNGTYTDFPSVKYQSTGSPCKATTLKKAQKEPSPTLPRRSTTRSWNATAKERNPLASCLTGVQCMCSR